MSGKFKELEDTDELEDLNEFLAQLPGKRDCRLYFKWLSVC